MLVGKAKVVFPKTDEVTAVPVAFDAAIEVKLLIFTIPSVIFKTSTKVNI